jgi:tetratricopeptide (TPR) repeat protein
MEEIKDLKECEDRIEKALTSLEQAGQLHDALAVYQRVETKLESMEIPPGHRRYTENQRVLAYCLLRQVNILRQLGEVEAAAALSRRELSAARASEDEITLARSFMSHGTTLLVAGGIEKGLIFVEKARQGFEKGNSYDHRQGLGWYWILKADLLNAGIVAGRPADVVECCGNALTVLTPIKNWPGVARAYAARAQAYEAMGEYEKAAADRKAQAEYENMEESKKRR